MEELIENVIQLDGSIGVKEASDAVKPIADKEVKNILYHHILVTEGIWKYLNDNDIVNCEPVNLRSCAKFLSEFEYTDIQLPNLSICVRAVYDEEILFVPKSHFEHNITPDVYLFVKVDDELKTGNVLGFVRPDLINKKNDNGKYYFVNRTFIKPFSDLISLIKNSNIKEQFIISDKVESTIEKIIIGYFDNDIDENKREKLFEYLINSSIAREKLVEFENFERLSYMSLNEFKDLDIQNNDFSKYLRTLFPKDEFSDFDIKGDMQTDDNKLSAGGLFIDDDLIQNTQTQNDEINQAISDADEFEIFENQEDELPSIIQNEELNEEFLTDLPTEDTVTDEQLKETDVFDEDEFTDDAITDIPVGKDEGVVVPEDLELNVLDDINQQSKGLDADTVIGLTEDVLYDGEEHPMETELSQELTDEKELNELDFITTDEVDKVIEEVTAQEPSQISELNDMTDFTEEMEFPKEIEETDETDMINNDTGKIFEDADIDTSLISNDTPYQFEQSDQEEGSVFIQDEDDEDVGMIKSSSIDGEIVNDENADLNEIYNKNQLDTDIANATEIADENITNDEQNDTDFDFASDNESGNTLQKKVIMAVSASVVILCLVGIGAWHLLFQSKSADNSLVDNDSTGNTEMTDFNFDVADMTGNSETDGNQVKSKDDDNISANVKLPAQLPPVKIKENEEQSKQLTIQKIKKDFSKPNTYISVSKIVWDVPEYMTYNDDFNVYLQTVGSSLKVNLSSDLLLITENPILNNIKLKISIKNNGKTYSADIVQGCGTQSIDSLVLQSVKKTMDILKPPVNNLDTADEDLYLTICL